MKVDNAPLTLIGILLLIVGWFSVFSGIFGALKAEDTVILSLRLESLILDTTFVSEGQILFHMATRIILGFIVIFIGNSFLVRGLHECHEGICHPRFGSFRRLG